MDSDESIEFVMEIFNENMLTSLQNYVCWSLDIQGQLLDYIADYGLLMPFLDRLSDGEASYIYAVNECHIRINELENQMDALTNHRFSAEDKKPTQRPPETPRL